MPIRTPESIRRALGEEAAADLVPWVEQIVAERAVPRDEYRQVLARLEIVEHDVADIKVEQRELRREMGEFRREVNERFDQMYQHFEVRFDRMNERFDQMHRHSEVRFDRMNERFDQMYDRMLVQTRWMVGTIAVFGTLITALLAVSRFSP